MRSPATAARMSPFFVADASPVPPEADCFARNLLAPRRVALEQGLDFADYPKVFGISAAAARMCERWQEMDEEYGIEPIK